MPIVNAAETLFLQNAIGQKIRQSMRELARGVAETLPSAGGPGATGPPASFGARSAGLVKPDRDRVWR